jgi:hypothetical protein
MGTPVLSKKTTCFGGFYFCAPVEIRTPVLALKGPRPGPLDDGGLFEGQSGRILPSPPAPVKQLAMPAFYPGSMPANPPAGG